MRILVAAHGFPPTFYAGAERAAERIVHWLVANGHEVEVFAIEKLDSEHVYVQTTQENGYTIHRLFYNLHHYPGFVNMYAHPAVRQAFQQVLEEKPFDIVHIISGYLLGGQAIHIAKNAGIPVVITLTEFWFMCPRLNLLQSNGKLCSGPDTDQKCARCLMEEKRRYRLPARVASPVADLFWSASPEYATPVRSKIDDVAQRRHAMHEALKAADLIISPSRFLIGKFAEYGFDTSRFVYIRHGLTINQERSDRQNNSPRHQLRLGYIGQIKPHKGTDILIDAVLSLIDADHDITLTIWGPEHEAPEYAQQLRRRTTNYPSIFWKGRYDAPQVWNILAKFDILVVPSRWYENSPTVIAEAFTIGLPVIATQLGGMAELIEHEKNGLLFQLNDAHDLQQQISKLLEQPDLLNKLRKGIPKVKTAEDEISEIFEQYQELVG